MIKKEEGSSIMSAGWNYGRAQDVMRFSTQEEYEAWHNKQIDLLAEVLAPIGEEPFDENLHGDKIAVRYAEIHAFEVSRINGIRRIIGDFKTYDDYLDHCEACFNSMIDEFWKKELNT